MAHDAVLLPVTDSGGCRDDMETDGGAGGCTPRAGKVGPRSNPGPYFLILKSEHCRFTEDQIIGILRESRRPGQRRSTSAASTGARRLGHVIGTRHLSISNSRWANR